jgi:hypothetical protein
VQAELNLAPTAVLFYVIADGTANIMLKVTGIAPWPWKSGLKYNFTEWFHHIMYAGGMLTVWAATEKIVDGSDGGWEAATPSGLTLMRPLYWPPFVRPGCRRILSSVGALVIALVI